MSLRNSILMKMFNRRFCTKCIVFFTFLGFLHWSYSPSTKIWNMSYSSRILQQFTGPDVYRSDVNHHFSDFVSNLTQTYHMVCLTYEKPKHNVFQVFPKGKETHWNAGGDKRYILPGRVCLHKQKTITIYQDSLSSESKRKEFGAFKLKFQPVSERPPEYELITNQTAYFLGDGFAFEAMNFFHFTRQIYFPLYWMIKSTNQLHENAQNIVFYPKPYAHCVERQYLPLDINRYQYFRDILYVRNKDDLSAFNDKPLPDKVCYKNTVFTSELFIDKALMAIEYFKSQIGISDSYCNSEKDILTIINRKSYRRIKNANELKKVGDALGYHTKVVNMELMTLKEQAQLIHCSKVLVGVVGAGLQWAFFMKNHLGVIEIGWPHEGWEFFFTGSGDYESKERGVIRPLNFVQLANVTCQLNPKGPSILLKDVFNADRMIPYNEAMAILKDKRNYDYQTRPSHTVAKLCDIIVDREAFRAAVISAGKSKGNY